MKYHMEPDDKEGLTEWMIDLEVGTGVAKGYAAITDLRFAKKTYKPDGTVELRKTRCLTLPLEFEPTMATAIAQAEEIGLALLEIPGKAKPSHRVLFVIFDGLTAATADRPPKWSHPFKYVVTQENHQTGSIPIASFAAWAHLDNENPRKPN